MNHPNLNAEIFIGQFPEFSENENIDLMINNVKSLGFNEIIVQVRSFCDAIYPSKIYPWSSVITGNESVSYSYDVLDYFIIPSHNVFVKYNYLLLSQLHLIKD